MSHFFFRPLWHYFYKVWAPHSITLLKKGGALTFWCLFIVLALGFLSPSSHVSFGASDKPMSDKPMSDKTTGDKTTGDKPKTLNIVSSIPPIYSLVQGVIGTTRTQTLLIKATLSPHFYALTPTGGRAIQKADVVFWVGPDMSPAFVKLALDNPKFLTLSLAKGITLLPRRHQGLFSTQEETYRSLHNKDKTTLSQNSHGDAHIWLSPDNAIAMVQAIEHKLSQLDPARKVQYEKNSKMMIAHLHTLKKQISQQMKTVQKQPFIVYHDGFHYFENAFDLMNKGAIAGASGKKPGAQTVARLHRYLETHKIKCLFIEPLTPKALPQHLIEGGKTQLQVLDPLGQNLPLNQGLYGQLMMDISQNIKKCLSPFTQ